MLLFLRRIAERLGDFLDFLGVTDGELDRMYPWDSEFETDYNGILYRANRVKFMNPHHLVNANNMTCLFLDRHIEVKILIPTGYDIVSLFSEEKDLSKSPEYGYPYIILSEHDKDCRIVIFESVDHQIDFLNKIATDIKPYRYTIEEMKDHIRVIRQYDNPKYGYFSQLNHYDEAYTGVPTKVNTDSFDLSVNQNKITHLIKSGTTQHSLDTKVKSDFTYLRPALLTKITLNDSKNFIESWDV